MNIAQVIMHLYPTANQMIDFMVQDNSDGNGPFIAFWNLPEPQPTETELQAAWEAYLEEQANKPPVLTEIEQLQSEVSSLWYEIMTIGGA
ncbi:hypothetical protein H1230_13420 [Paenibacillus sp. 19GGS1-52]|uniref:XkdW family protein n=1 Tax=Paenibacillus sp. 19GGS1-52 TaxID=2758563 RepID=UPI001EFB7730|nr:XkdW family protein [Paenibacillus sp. 19GGS1-52]ULO09680.1 hypothetical protein H1230_13420 [Paenibacillus sp. 19GGS1-52]